MMFIIMLVCHCVNATDHSKHTGHFHQVPARRCVHALWSHSSESAGFAGTGSSCRSGSSLNDIFNSELKVQ